MSRISGTAWRWYLAALLAATAGYFATPDTWLQTICYDSIAISGAVAMLVGVQLHRPAAAALWRAFALSQALMVTGDFVYALYARAFHQTPYPAPADVFYLVATVLEIVVLALVVRRRVPQRDIAGVTEALILAGAFALISWVYLMKPVTHSTELTTAGKLVAISYPVLDLLLLAVLARMLVGGAARNGAFLLLAAGMFSYLAADYAWAFTDHFQFVANTFTSHLMDAGYLLAFGLYGVAGLHPGLRELASPVPMTGRRFSRARLLLLTAATMISPGVLAWQAWRSDHRVPDATAIVIGSAGMFLLVVARMIILVRQVEHQSAVLARQAVELAELAQRDPLTGLANRRAWEHALPLALDRTRHGAVPLAMAIIDLDHFKRYNDTLGHQAGDRLLKEASAAWLSRLTVDDLLARYGGEEFAVLLPGRHLATARQLLDLLRGLTPSRQTFSAGVAVWDGRESAEAFFARADAALYRAKEAGRNRVEVAELAPQRPVSG